NYTNLNPGVARFANVAVPDVGVLCRRTISRSSIQVWKIHRRADAVSKHLADEAIPFTAIADHVRLQAVFDDATTRGGLPRNEIISSLKRGGRKDHDFAALPVDGQGGYVFAVHVIEKFFNDLIQHFDRHEVVGLVLKTVITSDVALIGWQ